MIEYHGEFYGTYMWPYVHHAKVVEERNLQHFLGTSWPSKTLDLDKATVSYAGEGQRTGFFEIDDVVCTLSNSHGSSSLSAAAADPTKLEGIVEKAQKFSPIYRAKDPSTVEVKFWSLGATGPESYTRTLDVPTWKDIQVNYSQEVNTELTTFMNGKWRPDKGGQLLLWYGPPGTGKTTALRALGREWRKWCELHYVVDPDVFFGKSAAYMMNVLIDGASEKDKWRLLILEDCGELITADAKQNAGQGLSRLLNSVDGLIGQGLRFMVLITTNESFGKLHQAVTRPGRCLSQLEFGKLDNEEVIKWLEANKMAPDKVKGGATLAELFAEKENFNHKAEPSKSFGFSV